MNPKNLSGLDNSLIVETPEGICLEFRLAGPVVRAAAWMIDFCIRALIFGALSAVFAMLGAFGVGMMLIGFFLLAWIYSIFFELFQGATPGKRAMGLRVVHSNGTPISWRASTIRNLLRSIDQLPVAYGCGLTAMLLNKNFQRLGDIAADTMVIYASSKVDPYAIPDWQAKRPPSGLTQDQYQAIVSFAERKTQLTEERAMELAGHLTPLTRQTGNDAVNEILGYACWLVKGER